MQEIIFPVEFLIEGTPLSLQASGKSKESWKKHVKASSYAGLPEQHIWFEGPVAITIFYFPPERMEGDIDNIVKPMLDALCAHIYKDDQQVVRVTIQKFEPGQPMEFANPSAILTDALVGTRPLTYVHISDSPFGSAI